tara:strand:+ start:4568 stop:5149 length:582 start_codon:yes stop_codon:yes gene_type:complete
MTKNYEDKIAQGELEKLGVKKKDNLFDISSGQSGIWDTTSDVEPSRSTLFPDVERDRDKEAEQDYWDLHPNEVPTWQSTLADDDLTDIPQHLDRRKSIRKTTKFDNSDLDYVVEDKWIDDIVDEQAVINHKQLDKIVDDVVKTLGDYLESKQMIYATGKAPNKLRKIIKTFITSQTKYRRDDDYLSYKNKRAK